MMIERSAGRRFADKSIVVTGGAMGIGAATVGRLVSEGARVIIADRNREAAEEAIASLEGPGVAEFVDVDLADPSSITAMAGAIQTSQPSLNGLVNNAGIVRSASLAQSGDADWDPQVAVNLRGPLLCAQALLPCLIQGGGSIVNISSEAAFRPRPGNAIYDATKAGVCALTRSMASELADKGIRVNTIAPGWTVTEMHTGRGPDAAEKRTELEALDHPGCILGRLGRPAEIAAAIAFLLSDDASYITASTLHVDGGRVAN